MKSSWVMRIVISVGLGMVLTVAVAWSSLIVPHMTIHATAIVPDKGVEWGVMHFSRWSNDFYWVFGPSDKMNPVESVDLWVTMYCWSVRPHSESRLSYDPPEEDKIVWADYDVLRMKRPSIEEVLPSWINHPKADQTITVHASGWPFRCLQSKEVQQTGSTKTELAGVISIPYLSRLVNTDWPFVRFDGAFPFLPIWKGAATNIALYSSAIWLCLISLSSVRRFRRQRRGHCPICNYDLLADFKTGCPECGHNRQSPPPENTNPENPLPDAPAP